MNLSPKELSSQIHKKINKIIWSQQINGKRISYCNLYKQSETGLFNNQRFFLLVHGQYFGYRVPLSEDQKLPFGSFDKLPPLKYKLPLNKIVRLETINESIVVITFEQGQVPKKWNLDCPSESTAYYLLQLLTNQCKLRKKKGQKKGENSFHKKQNDRQPIFDDKHQSSKKKQKQFNQQDIINIYSKSEQKRYFTNQPQVKKLEEDDVEKSQLKKQVSRLTQALKAEKNKQSELIPDYKREEQKDLLLKQLQTCQNKCIEYEQQILSLRRKFQQRLKQKDDQIMNLKKKLMNK